MFLLRLCLSAQVVLRLNNAPSVGFEKWVGSKTTHRLINNQWTREYGLKETLQLELNSSLIISRADTNLVSGQEIFHDFKPVPKKTRFKQQYSPHLR
jgi:heme oxygenase